MNCSEVRLDEFLDGELTGPDRQAVESHLAACSGCRAELDALGKLERVLKSVPPGDAPETDRFLMSVRSRSRLGDGALRAVAAAFLVGLAGFLFWPRPTVDVRAELAAYALKPSDAIEDRVRAAGGEGLKTLEASLGSEDPKLRFAAAVLLFKLADGETRERALARFQDKADPNGGWVLNEPGVDDEDEELVPVVVDALGVAGQRDWALDMLKKLQVLNLEAREKVVDSVVTLLKHSNPEIQKHALDMVQELGIEFPLSAIVDLLDSPELGDQALRVLREATGRDFGKDKGKWKKAIESKEVNP